MSQPLFNDVLDGKVVKRLYAAGSKSERMAVMLEVNNKFFRLQRVGGNPFSDQVLENLVGYEISAIGQIKNNLFIITGYTIKP